MKVRKTVQDLGQGAFLKLYGHKPVGKRGKNYYFEVEESETDEFDQLLIEYANSQYHAFDSELLSLKKLPDFLPAERKSP